MLSYPLGTVVLMDMQNELVYGEPVDTLLVGVLAFVDAATIDDDGMVVSSVALEPTVGAPVLRALRRAEAELLLQDADALGSEHYEDRTAGQRRADAFMLMAKAVLARTRSRPGG